MKFVVVVACLAALALAEPLFRQELVDEINNNPSAHWKAGLNERFIDVSADEFKASLGAFLNGPRLPQEVNEVSGDIPTTFDARTTWPTCIGAIRDQGKCGSCWAFGAVEALSDRFCIHSSSHELMLLSAQDVTSCDKSDQGCNGGWLETAWSYFVRSGVVTEKCWPYELPPCHHPCGTPEKTPSCKSACHDPAIVFTHDKHYAKNVYAVSSSVTAIQTEIMNNGPVEAAFQVYSDFPNYKSGVYHHTSGSYLGGHAIKIMGWGVEDGMDYWLIANSWNTEWGNNGLFKMLRGKNECGIEGNVVAGMPKY